MNNKEIGNKIKSRRKELNLTLQEVAVKVGVASSTIQRYENGSIAQCKLPVLESIAKALNVNPVWLIRNDAPMSINISDKPPLNYNNLTDKSINTLDLNFTSEFNLSNTEKQHIENLRKLNDIGKNKVYTYTKDLIDNPKFTNINTITKDETSATLYVKEENEPYLFAAHNDDIDEDTNKANIEKIKNFYNNLKGNQ